MDDDDIDLDDLDFDPTDDDEDADQAWITLLGRKDNFDKALIWTVQMIEAYQLKRPNVTIQPYKNQYGQHRVHVQITARTPPKVTS
jgi:hypothetical protein